MSKEIELSTAVQIATELGVHRLTISRIARDHKIGRKIGSTIVFTKSDASKIKKLCRVSKGNPNFGKNLKKI
jgi:hypothetical protein